MLPRRIDAHLQVTCQWLLILLPLACSVSRFASDVLLSTIAVLFLVHSLLMRRFDWLKVGWVQVALVLWVYTLLLCPFAPDMASALGRAAAWLRFPVFAAACAFWLLQERRIRTRLILSLSVAVGFMLLDTALQYFTGTDILGFDAIPSEGSNRLTGPFSSPRVGIVLIWMCVPVVAYWLMAEGGGARKGKGLLAGLFFSVGVLTVVFMSGERMALLLTGLSFAIAFFILPVPKRLMLAIGLAGALLMGLLAYTNPGLVKRQMDSTTRVVDEFESSDYGQIWQSAINIAKDHPFFGVGLRQFREVCPDARYGSPENVAQRCNLHPHNIYLEWLSESGAIGLLLFVIMIIQICLQMLRTYPTLRADPVFLGLLITLLIRFWPLSSSTSFFAAWSAVPMWLMVGWAMALCQRPKP